MSYLFEEMVPGIKQTGAGIQRWLRSDYSDLQKIVAFKKFRLGYIPISRACSGSLLQYFGSRSEILKSTDKPPRIRAIKWPNAKPSNTDLIFTFVRNPWVRLYSLYRARILQAEGVAPISRDVELSTLPFRSGRFYFEMPFDAFVEEVCRTPNAFSDPQLCSQTRLLSDSEGAFLPHFLGRVERFEADLARLCRMVGLPEEPALRWFASKTHPKYGREVDDYRFVYTGRLYAKVARRYADDVRLLGYRPGIDKPVSH